MKILGALLCLAPLTCAVLSGQAISTSQIAGIVQDASGLPVADAEVRAVQTTTGAVRTVATGATGTYVMPELPVGTYRLEVRKEGFSPYVQSGIVLQVNSNPSINVTLVVGSVNEQVSVTADAAMVETHSTGVGQVVNSRDIVELPLNGRQPAQLIYLSAGATAGRTNRTTYPNQDSPSIGGGGAGTVSFVLDGGMFNDPLSSLSLPLPFPDVLQEFKVESNALSAQYGYHSTGTVNGVTKSGGNEIHGDLFEFVRNYLFNARNTFAAARDSLKRNQFGGTIGGPIVKNKLFYFVGYQGTTQVSNPATAIAYVPTPDMLAGNFTTVTSPSCNVSGQIHLSAAAGFVNNQISPALFSPPAAKLAGLLPVPTDPCGRLQFGAPANLDEEQALVRIDYQLSARNSLFGRYYITHLEQPPGNAAVNLLLAGTAGASDQVQSAVIGNTYLISSNMVSSFRAAGNRNVNTTVLNSFASPADLGVNMYSLPYPKFSVISVAPNGFNLGTTPQTQPYDTTQFSEDISWVRGAHQIQFGAGYIDMRAFSTSGLQQNGNFAFNGQATGLANADLLLGDVATLSQGVQEISNQRQALFAMYAQDSWKLSSRLSINAGVRWEPLLAPTSPYDQVFYISLPAFQQGTRSNVYVNAPAGMLFDGDPGGPTGAKYFNNTLNHFAPRIGMVWDPIGDGRTSIRAGYGIFFDLPPFSYYQVGFSPPFGDKVTLAGVNFQNPYQNYPGGNPFPLAVGKNTPFPLAGQLLSFLPDTVPPSVQHWNLSIQRQVGANWMVSASYAGNHTTHLWAANQASPAIYMPGASCVIAGVTYKPCSSVANTNQRRLLALENPNQGKYYGSTSILDDGGTASYNSLILSLERRLSGVFTMAANYTWSHCISDPYVTSLSLPNDQYTHPGDRRADRGNCIAADVRHVANVTVVAQSPKYSSRTLQLVAGDWKLSGIARVQTGNYVAVTTGIDNALSGLVNQRPIQVLSDPYMPSQSADGWLNPKAFAQPAAGTFGDLGMNSILAPGAFTINLALTRQFRIRERHTVEFRGEAFNLLNWVNLGSPNAALNSPIFGTINTAADPRILQFALRYIF